MPDTDYEAALGRIGYAIPVHMSARLFDDPYDVLDVRARLSKFLQWEISGCTNERRGLCCFQKLVNFGVGQVVGKQNWTQAVKRASCE